ncbi:MAG: ATP-binding cassette domain-containing protein [Candidatus Bipolaricaulia bacterium]
MIQVSELHFTTEDGIKVLEDVHLHVDRGELVYLIGEAAVGKTLLLGLLGAQIRPQHGQVLVHGRNVARLSREKALHLRRQVGLMPHGFVPLPRTTLGNLLFKLRALGDFREQAEEKALIALEMVGLLRHQTTDASELSAVERLRLGVALSICSDPLLLLVDDLFDGLAPDDKEQICTLLERVHDRGMTILAATRGPLPAQAHRHRVLELVDGRVVGQ